MIHVALQIRVDEAKLKHFIASMERLGVPVEILRDRDKVAISFSVDDLARAIRRAMVERAPPHVRQYIRTRHVLRGNILVIVAEVVRQ